MGVIRNDVGRPSNKTILIRNILKTVAALSVVILIVFVYYKNDDDEGTSTKTVSKKSEYRIINNSINDFDLFFLKEENNGKNKVYSPLSIKYALAMLKEGASGNTKEQISSVVGDYEFKKYSNSKNLSLQNVLFVKNSYKQNINENYINLIKDKYNSNVFYDDFASASNINSWVSENTFKQINDLFLDSDLNNKDFLLGNALAIDMEWVNKIQSENKEYFVRYDHEKDKSGGTIVSSIMPFLGTGFTPIKFNNSKAEYNSVELAADINNYDIVSVLGEDSIRKTVGSEYEKWLKTEDAKFCIEAGYNSIYSYDVNKYLDAYIKELNSNYKKIDSSTDFLMYSDNTVKAFAKDLKKYDGITLQYIGIMPNDQSLDSYIKTLDSKEINKVINNLKEIKRENFEDGVITRINANIPVFDFEYDLDLKNDLMKIGITDVFKSGKADLSGLTKQKDAYVSDTVHKANISFSNDGIKASAVTFAGGFGDAGCGFDYLYEVPVKEINLTFDKPYIFIIRDKESGEVWFSGSVYEPNLYTPAY